MSFQKNQRDSKNMITWISQSQKASLSQVLNQLREGSSPLFGPNTVTADLKYSASFQNIQDFIITIINHPDDKIDAAIVNICR